MRVHGLKIGQDFSKFECVFFGSVNNKKNQNNTNQKKTHTHTHTHKQKQPINKQKRRTTNLTYWNIIKCVNTNAIFVFQICLT